MIVPQKSIRHIQSLSLLKTIGMNVVQSSSLRSESMSHPDLFTTEVVFSCLL